MKFADFEGFRAANQVKKEGRAEPFDCECDSSRLGFNQELIGVSPFQTYTSEATRHEYFY